MVWSKRPFLPVGFSPAPVTKQCHSRTWTWFNSFEIFPVKGLNIGNIQSTNSKCLWNKQDFLCSQESAIQKDDQRGAKEKRRHRKGLYLTGGKTWAMFFFADCGPHSLYGAMPCSRTQWHDWSGSKVLFIDWRLKPVTVDFFSDLNPANNKL